MGSNIPSSLPPMAPRAVPRVQEGRKVSTSETEPQAQGGAESARPSAVETAVSVSVDMDVRASEEQSAPRKALDQEVGGAKALIDSVRSAIKEASQNEDTPSLRVKTQVHEETGRYHIQVIDANTGETIREFPPVDYLDAVATMDDLIGSMVEEEI